MHLPRTGTPEGTFDYLLAFIFVAMLTLAALYVLTGLVPL
ncbi:LPXTG cell wall anchor domain-containing protein [Halobium salinum]|uniref:LPXTG cell wall anchor domain-containing protein n=1 Tax=Halobium salinum TaxID=1364940 RepID=A0ABD5PAM0_9EURY|nr:LPXTG cell wall anchor domain-containing protein [Halobium salinum]